MIFTDFLKKEGGVLLHIKATIFYNNKIHPNQKSIQKFATSESGQS